MERLTRMQCGDRRTQQEHTGHKCRVWCDSGQNRRFFLCNRLPDGSLVCVTFTLNGIRRHQHQTCLHEIFRGEAKVIHEQPATFCPLLQRRRSDLFSIPKTKTQSRNANWAAETREMIILRLTVIDGSSAVRLSICRARKSCQRFRRIPSALPS